MSEAVAAQGEVRMLIDGKLVEAAAGKTFDNINPATEEVIGPVADASAADMERAIAAARRAFDETDWSTEPRVPQAVPRCSCRRRSKREQEELRQELVAEVGTPDRCSPTRPQLDAPLDDGDAVAGRADRRVRVGARPRPTATSSASTSSRRKVVEGAGRRRRRDHAVELPVRGQPATSSAQALAAGNTVVLKPAPDTPWNATRIGRLIAEQTDIPPGVVNVVTSSDHLVGEELTRRPARRHDLVHRLDRDRQAHHGEAAPRR